MSHPEKDSNLTPEIIRTIHETLAKICAYTEKRFAVLAMDGDGTLDLMIVARDAEAQHLANAIKVKIREFVEDYTAKRDATSPTTTTTSTTTPPPPDRHRWN